MFSALIDNRPGLYENPDCFAISGHGGNMKWEHRKVASCVWTGYFDSCKVRSSANG